MRSAGIIYGLIMNIKKIIIHCSAVGPQQTSSAAQIDAWHRAKGLQMIGYHYVIRRDGTVERGRPEGMVGAHTQGQNKYSIGICYEGGLKEVKPLKSEKVQLKPADTRTPAQKAALLKLLRELKVRYPRATIHGHNEFAAKACPCFDAHAEYAGLQP